jgi:exopolysaccharide biosynthesis polyprenyl glycosylphosphotransferase
MNAVRRRLLTVVLKLFDLLVMAVSFVLASIPVSLESGKISLAEFFSIRVKVANFVLFSVLLMFWHIMFSVLGLYHSKRLSARQGEFADVVKGTTLGTLAVSAASVMFRIRMATPTFVLLFWVLTSVAAVSSRLALGYLLRLARLRGRNLRNMLVVGTNQRAVAFGRKIEATAELGYRIIGFVDEEWPGIEEFRQNGYQLVCNFDGIPNFLREKPVDEVMIALPLRSLYFHASRIAALCEEQGIAMSFLSGIFNLRMARCRAEEFEGDTSITFHRGMPEGWSTVVKRLVDLIVSLGAIIALAPLLLITAILIKLTSPGRLFFKQERLGINKRKFFIYKFRTMVPDAENRLAEVSHLNEASGPVFKIRNDPRITPVGRWLRKTSIDELPQLFNVLKGDMSLVGPRPLPVRDYEGFSQDWHRRRFSVPPGITCLWQIAGRSSIPFDKWMKMDLQYIDEWSLWLDLRILIRTIPAVLRGSGAA